MTITSTRVARQPGGMAGEQEPSVGETQQRHAGPRFHRQGRSIPSRTGLKGGNRCPRSLLGSLPSPPAPGGIPRQGRIMNNFSDTTYTSGEAR